MTAPARAAWAAAAAVVVGLGVVIAISGADAVERYGLVDFYDYYYAADAVARGDDPYDAALADTRATAAGVPTLPGSHYLYAPWFAAALVPLTWLPPRTAGLLWYGICALTLALALRELARWSGGRWGPLIAVLFPGTLVALFVGQVNPLVLALFVGAWRWRDSRPALAGGMLGAAIAIKLTPVLLLVPCLRWRRWRLIAAVTAVAAFCSIAGEIAVPGGGWHHVSQVVPHASELRPELAHPSNQGLGATVVRMLSPNPWTTPWLVAPDTVEWITTMLIVGVLTALLLRVKRGEDERTAWSAAIAALVLVSPLAWEALFVVLLFPMAVLAATRPRWAAACFLLTVLQRALDGFAHAPDRYPWLQAVPPLVSLGLVATLLLFVSLLWRHGR